jgi:hypothetical protein
MAKVSKAEKALAQAILKVARGNEPVDVYPHESGAAQNLAARGLIDYNKDMGTARVTNRPGLQKAANS